METGKRYSQEFSELDRTVMDCLEEEESVKRSYGCMFCKQGFTNAQALGGHMNIHRKDRPKGKGHQHLSGTSSDDKKLEDQDIHFNPGTVGEERLRSIGSYMIRSHVHQGMADLKKFVRIPGTSTVFPRQKRSFMERNFWAGSPQSPGETDHGNLDDSLSLSIGSSLSSDNKEPKIDVDLELRLGRDPPFEAR